MLVHNVNTDRMKEFKFFQWDSGEHLFSFPPTNPELFLNTLPEGAERQGRRQKWGMGSKE